MPTSFEVLSLKAPTIGWIACGACFVLAIYRLDRNRKLLIDLPGPEAPSWVTGHFRVLFGLNAIQYLENLVSNYGPTFKIKAALGTDAIWTIDPAAMHSILVKDRANFERPPANRLFARAVSGPGLLALSGEEHRIHRKILNPVFTMRFLRELMPVFMNVTQRACDMIDQEIGSDTNSRDLDVFQWMASAALELIGEAGLGYSFESFEGKRNKYSTAVKDIVRFFAKFVPFAAVLPYLSNIGTPAFRLWAVQYLPIPGIRRLLEARSIQHDQAEEVLRARQELLASGGDLKLETGCGRDILTLLMKANEAEGSENHISREEMIGHMNIFIFAGHETTSTAMSRIISILASNQNMQNTLREEVQQYFLQHPDDTHYEGLLELPYLDAIVRETLRVYAPVSSIGRMSQVDTVIPLQYPINAPNGKITSIPVRKGTRVLMNLIMANRYQHIWGDRANEFVPERWIGAKLDEVTEPGAHLPGVYSSMMTFGGGPTACIGFKFAVMEIKVMISNLIRRFKFEQSEQSVCWEAQGIQFPYLKSELNNQTRLPKLPIQVARL